ncbi:MAG: metallophosphoesterase, partial [Coriobacteriia bacterium]|nr:metallophosphoesterase [Coriobacteriia bacterium]
IETDTILVGTRAAAIAALVVLSLLALAAFEASRFRVASHALVDPRLPRSFDGTRLVFLADVHVGPYYGKRRMARLVRCLNELRADVVVLGGDYVGGRRGGASTFYAAAARILAERGVFAVLGNHDVWEGEAEAREGLARAGITLVENSNVRLRGSEGDLVLAGLADAWTGDPDPEAAAEGIADGEFAVLVTHNPDILAEALPRTPRGLYALVLAAHTHGGQAPGAIPMMTRAHKPTHLGRRYLRGWRIEEDSPILVTHGVGTVTLPLRLLRPPEVHVITLSATDGERELRE